MAVVVAAVRAEVEAETAGDKLARRVDGGVCGERETGLWSPVTVCADLWGSSVSVSLEISTEYLAG